MEEEKPKEEKPEEAKTDEKKEDDDWEFNRYRYLPTFNIYHTFLIPGLITPPVLQICESGHLSPFLKTQPIFPTTASH